MKITHIALVIGGLFLLSKWSHGRAAEKGLKESTPSDPYAGVTDIWEALNGININGSGYGPNAAKPYVAQTVNQSCVCPGHVGVM